MYCNYNYTVLCFYHYSLCMLTPYVENVVLCNTVS